MFSPNVVLRAADTIRQTQGSDYNRASDIIASQPGIADQCMMLLRDSGLDAHIDSDELAAFAGKAQRNGLIIPFGSGSERYILRIGSVDELDTQLSARQAFSHNLKPLVTDVIVAKGEARPHSVEGWKKLAHQGKAISWSVYPMLEATSGVGLTIDEKRKRLKDAQVMQKAHKQLGVSLMDDGQAGYHPKWRERGTGRVFGEPGSNIYDAPFNYDFFFTKPDMLRGAEANARILFRQFLDQDGVTEEEQERTISIQEALAKEPMVLQELMFAVLDIDLRLLLPDDFADDEVHYSNTMWSLQDARYAMEDVQRELRRQGSVSPDLMREAVECLEKVVPELSYKTSSEKNGAGMLSFTFYGHDIVAFRADDGQVKGGMLRDTMLEAPQMPVDANFHILHDMSERSGTAQDGHVAHLWKGVLTELWPVYRDIRSRHVAEILEIDESEVTPLHKLRYLAQRIEHQAELGGPGTEVNVRG